MISLEQAFSESERTGESVRKSATGLATRAKALARAAKEGNIAAVRREQGRLVEALNSLQQEVQNAASSWPFTDEEVEQYLSGRYADELKDAASEVGLEIYERDRNLISYPSIVRVLPRENAVRVDKKKVSTIRPSHLADLLLKNQTKTSGFPSDRFLEALYTVYSGIVSGETSDLLAEGSGVVVPLSKIYKLVTALPGAAREYDPSDFARDLYILDADGPRRTREGKRVSFPSSTGTRRRTRDLFTFVGPEGQSVVYYGIRFSEDI